MSIQFPANKFVNDTFPYNGLTYVWDGEKWTASGAAAFEDAYVNVSGDTMTGDLTVPSLNGGPLAGFRNRLVNGGFDIWQRSLDVTSTGSGYKTADRWYIETKGVNTVSKRIDIDDTTNNLKNEAPTAYGMRLHANGSPLEVRQCIELGKTGAAQEFLPGTQWFISWYSDLRNGSTNKDGTFIDCRVSFADNSSDPGTNTELISPLVNLGGRRWGFPITIQTTPPATATCLRIDLVTGNVNEFEFTGVQLEPGSVATPFEHRPIATELTLCQRYYFLATKVYAVAGERSGTKASFPYSFPTSMRQVPTVAGYGGGNAASYSDITKENLSMRLTVDYISQGFTADAEL